MTASPTVPQHPFSTILSVKIVEIVHARDLDLNKLRSDYQSGAISQDEFKAALLTSESRLADDVLEACVKTLANLESSVNQVLQLNEQLRFLRSAGVVPTA